MTALPPDAVIHGHVTREGLLVSADPALLAFQEAAGGTLGGPLVVPALAQLVRLAGRLRMPIARPVTVAGVDGDSALWVKLKPVEDGIDLAIIAQEEVVRTHDGVDVAALDAHAELAREGWVWRTDRRLQFVAVETPEQAPDHDLPGIGEPLSAYFRLLDSGTDGEGAEHLPLLSAIGASAPFSGQRAAVRADERIHYLLAGLPLFDARGRLSGYRGKARLVAADAAPAEQPDMGFGESAPFGRRLDLALRQPLGRIIANANTIADQLDGPLRSDYVSYATDIAAAGRHLLGLVADLGDLQAIERPDFTVAREQVDLADLARQAVGLLRMRAADRHIVVTPPDNDAKAMAVAEYRRVLQILVNLVGNAVRYSPDDSAVWIRVDEDGEKGIATVLVADQGYGIAPADHERIFARFERLAADDGAGSGLGLYISRRLARAMGGDIAVDSEKGQGARFTLTLPLWSGEI